MHTLNQEPSKFYIEEMRTLYSAIADASGFDFKLEYYKENSGAMYRFLKKQ